MLILEVPIVLLLCSNNYSSWYYYYFKNIRIFEEHSVYTKMIQTLKILLHSHIIITICTDWKVLKVNILITRNLVNITVLTISSKSIIISSPM